MNLRNESCFDDLEEDLKYLSAQGRLIYIPNPGNWGDALIAAGSRQFFAERKIAYKEINFFKVRQHHKLRLMFQARSIKPIMIYGGNGAFVDYYQRLSQLESITHKFESSLFMPSTFALGLEKMKFKRPPILFRRDEYESADTVPNSKFCHDMAFYLNPPHVTPSRRIGYFFREDKESPADVQLPEENRDLSGEGRDINDINEFFSAVGACEKVFTNRLHIAIAGSLLEREVHLFPNSYFKNQAIFRSSLEPFFKNTYFHNMTPQAYGL